MLAISAYLTRILYGLPVTLALLTGLIMAIILVVRHRGLPATLALIGFASLLVLYIGGQILDVLLINVVIRRPVPVLQFSVIRAGIGACCSTLGALATVCLLIGFWRAITQSGDPDGGES